MSSSIFSLDLIGKDLSWVGRKFAEVKDWSLKEKVALVAGVVFSAAFFVTGHAILGVVVAAITFSAVLLYPSPVAARGPSVRVADPEPEPHTSPAAARGPSVRARNRGPVPHTSPAAATGLAVRVEDIKNASGPKPYMSGDEFEAEAKEKAIHEVFPGLYLGGSYAVEKPSKVYSYSRTTKDSEDYDYVVSATTHVPYGIEGKDRFVFPVMRRDVGLDSFRSDNQFSLATAIREIHGRLKRGQKIFVHCQQGCDRSTTVILAYLMSLYPEISADEALNYVRTRRRLADPDLNYMNFIKNDFIRVSLV